MSKHCGTCAYYEPQPVYGIGIGGNGGCKKSSDKWVYQSSLACVMYVEAPKKKEKKVDPTRRCSSCAFFKSHKPVTPGAGGNSECLRTPGYYRSGVMDTCEFYAKKGKKVAKEKIEWDICVDCGGRRMTKNMVFVNAKAHRCTACHAEGLKTGRIKAVKVTPVDLSKVPRCPELQVGQPRSQVDQFCACCGDLIDDDSFKVKGVDGVLCFGCNNDHQEEEMDEKIKEENTPKSSTCVNCGKKFKTTVFIKAGGEAVCFGCRKKEPKDCCYTCGKYTKPGNRRLLPNSEGFICRTCATKSKLNLPNAPVPKEEKKVKVLCRTCGKYEDKGLTDVYERFIVIEGLSCPTGPGNVYMRTMPNLEEALRYITYWTPSYNGKAMKLFKVISASPIKLEELSLGYDIKVVSTREIKELKG